MTIPALTLSTGSIAASTPRAAQAPAADFAQLLLGDQAAAARGAVESIGGRAASDEARARSAQSPGSDGRSDVRLDADATQRDALARNAENARAADAARLRDPTSAARRTDAARSEASAELPSELYPMTSRALGRLSYLARDPLARQGAAGAGARSVRDSVATAGVLRPSRVGAGGVPASAAPLAPPAPGTATVAHSWNAAAQAQASDAVAFRPLPDSAELLPQRRISVSRSGRRVDVLIRDYRLSAGDRRELLHTLIVQIGEPIEGSWRIVINGEDCTAWAVAAARGLRHG